MNHKGQQRVYSRNDREWIDVTVHRAGAHTSPNVIHISDGYMVGTNGFPVPVIRLVDINGVEVWRGIGTYDPGARAYQEGDRIQVKITDLDQLSVFYIRYNQVKSLPINLGDLINTRTIGLRRNGTAGLGHVDLSRLPYLINLDLSDISSVTQITLNPSAPINFFYLAGTSINQANVDYLIQHAVDSGVLNGTMNYPGQPSYESTDNYNLLAERGWNMGTAPVAGTVELVGYTKAGLSSNVTIIASHRVGFYNRNADGTLREYGEWSDTHPGNFVDFVEDGYIETEYYHPSILSIRLDGKQLKTLQLTQYINAVNLNFNNNHITTVVLTQNTKLEQLRLANNPITSISDIAVTKLTYLDLQGTSLTSSGISSILGNLVTVGTLNGTFLYSIKPDDSGVTAYQTLIERGWTLSIAPDFGISVLTNNTAYAINLLDAFAYEAIGTVVLMETIGIRIIVNDAVAQSIENVEGIQTLLPDSDIAVGDWTVTPLFSKVNDGSDSTIITSTNANGSTCTLSITNPSSTTTGSVDDGILRFRARKLTGTNLPDLIVELINGSTGVVLGSFTQTIDATVLTEFQLSTPNILDPSMDLQARLTRSGGGSVNARAAIEVSDIWLQVEITTGIGVVIPVGTIYHTLIQNEITVTTTTVDIIIAEPTVVSYDIVIFNANVATTQNTIAETIAEALIITLFTTNIVIQSNVVAETQALIITLLDPTISTVSGPTAATNLTATPVSDTQIDLAWTVSPNATSQNIERKPGVNGSWISIATGLSMTISSFQNTDLLANTQYFYRIVSVDSNGTSLSEEANAYTFQTTVTITYQDITETTLTVNFSPVESGVTFRLFRKQGTGAYGLIYEGNATPSYNDSGLTAGTKYTYAVETYQTATNKLRTSYGAEVTTLSATATLDPDYQAVIDFAIANSVALPTADQQAIDNQLIIDYKATGGWAKDDVFFKFTGTADPAFKLICWKRKILASAYGSLTWNDSGVDGNLANAWIDTKFLPSGSTNWQINNAGITVSLKYVKTGNTQCTAGSKDTVVYVPQNSSSTSYYTINNKIALESVINYARVGLNGLYRIDANNIKLIGNGEVTYTRASTVIPLYTIGLLARHGGGAVGDLYSSEGLKFATLGAAKTTEFLAMENVLI